MTKLGINESLGAVTMICYRQQAQTDLSRPLGLDGYVGHVTGFLGKLDSGMHPPAASQACVPALTGHGGAGGHGRALCTAEFDAVDGPAD